MMSEYYLERLDSLTSSSSCIFFLNNNPTQLITHIWLVDWTGLRHVNYYIQSSKPNLWRGLVCRCVHGKLFQWIMNDGRCQNSHNEGKKKTSWLDQQLATERLSLYRILNYIFCPCSRHCHVFIFLEQFFPWKIQAF